MSKNQALPPELRIAQDHYRPGKNGPKSTLTAGYLAKPPTAPKGLSTKGKKEWRSVCKLLIEAGVLTQRDLFGIESYIRLREDLWQLEEVMNKPDFERFYRDSKGDIKSHPILVDMRSLRTAIFQYEKALGLNPCARARANAVAKENKSGPATKSKGA